MKVEIDIGNTRLKWRVRGLTKNHLSQKGVLRFDDYEELGRLWWVQQATRVSLASVNSRENIEKIKEILLDINNKIDIFEVKTEAYLGGLSCGYEKPAMLGVDRWVAMLAAYLKYPHTCLTVIDVGTAITVDKIDKEGNHLGGLIAPGAELMKTMLYKETHQIVDKDKRLLAGDKLGVNTISCVEHGVYKMAKSFVSDIIGEAVDGGDMVVLTGGGINGMEINWGRQVIVEENLVLDGIAFASDIYYGDYVI